MFVGFGWLVVRAGGCGKKQGNIENNGSTGQFPGENSHGQTSVTIPKNGDAEYSFTAHRRRQMCVCLDWRLEVYKTVQYSQSAFEKQ